MRGRGGERQSQLLGFAPTRRVRRCCRRQPTYPGLDSLWTPHVVRACLPCRRERSSRCKRTLTPLRLGRTLLKRSFFSIERKEVIAWTRCARSATTQSMRARARNAVAKRDKQKQKNWHVQPVFLTPGSLQHERGGDRLDHGTGMLVNEIGSDRSS